MPLPNIFSKEVSDGLIRRINALAPSTTPQWGKMSVDQMLAHCNVTYEMAYEKKHPEPGFLMKFILTLFVKKVVTGEAPYKRNQRTAPAFLMQGNKNFEVEKSRLVEYLRKTQALGEQHFNNKKSLSFGPLSMTEWNNMFYKHLDHHLTQFGV